MDKLVELIGKILEKLTSAKLIWTIIIALAILGVAFLIGPIADALNLSCLKNGSCSISSIPTLIGMVALAAISLILSAIIVWIAGLIKNKYFV